MNNAANTTAPANSDPSCHDVHDLTSFVPVSEFRNLIDCVFRHVTYHVGNARDHQELMQVAEMLRRAGLRLTHTGCKRAKAEDWDARERALDRSASLLIKIRTGAIKRAPKAPRLMVVR